MTVSRSDDVAAFLTTLWAPDETPDATRVGADLLTEIVRDPNRASRLACDLALLVLTYLIDDPDVNPDDWPETTKVIRARVEAATS